MFEDNCKIFITRNDLQLVKSFTCICSSLGLFARLNDFNLEPWPTVFTFLAGTGGPFLMSPFPDAFS